MGRNKRRQPSRAINPPDPRKVPRGAEAADNIVTMNLVWSVDSDVIDLDGPFGWHQTTPAELLTEIIPRLKNYETMKWADLPNTGSHDIAVEDCCKDARDRLTTLGLEFDYLYSLRISGRKRILGIKEGAI